MLGGPLLTLPEPHLIIRNITRLIIRNGTQNIFSYVKETRKHKIKIISMPCNLFMVFLILKCDCKQFFLMPPPSPPQKKPHKILKAGGIFYLSIPWDLTQQQLNNLIQHCVQVCNASTGRKRQKAHECRTSISYIVTQRPA